MGVYVDGLLSTLDARPDVHVAEYTVSVGARRVGEVRGTWVPFPARVAPWVWRLGRPRIERFVGPVDLVHGTNYVVPASRAPRLVTVYDLSYVHDATTVPASVAAFDRAVRQAIDSGAVVHTMSQYVAQEIAARYGAARIEVVPGALSPAVLDGSSAAPASEGRPTVLVLGATARRKRVPLVVQAFGRLAADMDIGLRIVGPEGDDEQAVIDAVAALPAGSSERVSRVGFVDDQARNVELRRAAALVFASEYEGFGYPLLEAMAWGTPVVTTLGGSLAEVAGDAALVVEQATVEELAGSLRQVLTDQATSSGLIERGRQRAALFGWDRIGPEMIGLYERLV